MDEFSDGSAAWPSSATLRNADSRAKDASVLQRWELLVLAGILLLATALRVAWPRLTEFKFSEARLEALALELTREGRLPLIGVPSSAGFDHSPISVYLYLPAFLFTTNPIPATIYGGLVGAAAVALCWWLARKWPGGGRWAAPVAALLFAVGPWSVAFSRKIWQVTFVPLLALVFAGLIVSALIEGSNRSPSARRSWRLAWALVVYALLVQVHPSALSLAPAVVLWLIVFWRRVRLGPLLVGVALGLLTAVPFLLHQARNGWPALAALGALPGAVVDLSSIRLGWEAITGRGIHALAGRAYPLLQVVPQLGWIFNLIGWLTVAAGLLLAWRMVRSWRGTSAERSQSARADFILLSWLVVPIVFNLRHSLDLHLHFFALVMPAAYLIVGRGVQALVDSARRGAPVRPVTAAASRWLAIGGVVSIVLLTAGQVIALVRMAGFVATHDTPGGFGRPLGQYLDVADQAMAMAERENADEILVVGQGDSPVVDEIPAIFDVLFRDRGGYRFVDGQSAALFPPHQALALVAPGAGEAAGWYQSWPVHALEEGWWLATLDGSWPQEGLTPITGPRVFQNGVGLLGYAWESGSAAGEQGEMWLLWQVLWLNEGDTHFFVHLVDEGGQVQGQQDAAGYPTDYRMKGDRIASKFDIIVEQDAPPGSSWARVGQYLYPQVINVPVIDDAGNPTADAVLVGPLGEGSSAVP